MQETKITCDGCGNDLTYTGNEEEYRLALNLERKTIHPDITYVTSMYFIPPIKKNKHFCGIECIEKWLEQNRQNQQARKLCNT